MLEPGMKRQMTIFLSYLYVQPNAKLHASKRYLFREIPQLGQLIQQLLQIPIGNLILQTGDQRFGFFRIVAAQTPCSCISIRNAMYTLRNITYPTETAQTSPTLYANSTIVPPP